VSVAHKVAWTILMAGLAGLIYLAFRGYLTPSMLLDFANAWTC